MSSTHPLRWLREAGILLLMISFLFLIWFSPAAPNVPSVKGWQLFTPQQTDVGNVYFPALLTIGGFGLAYLLSHWLPAQRRMLSLGPWVAALYGLLLLINRFALIDDPGSMYGTRSYDPGTFVNPYRLDTGVWLTVAAALLLFLGMYLPQLNLTQLSEKNSGIGLGLSLTAFFSLAYLLLKWGIRPPPSCLLCPPFTAILVLFIVNHLHRAPSIPADEHDVTLHH